MITFDQVTVQYEDTAEPVLRDVDLTVEEGELCLVVGHTGVGKSTLLGAVNGLVPHFTGGTLYGRVTVDGLDTADHPPRELADVVGVVGQDPLDGFVTDTVEEELAYAMEQLAVSPPTMRKRVEETLDLLGLAELRHRALHELSGGSSSASPSARSSPPTRGSWSWTNPPPRSTRPPRKRSWPPSPGSSTTSASPSSSPNTAWSASSSTRTA